MSDYLSNLVDKSLNLTEVVQPRLTMLFEPQQSATWSTPGLGFNMEMIDDEQTIYEGEVNAFSMMKPIVEYPADSKSFEVNQDVSHIDIDKQNSTSSSATKEQLHQLTDQDSDKLVLPKMPRPIVNLEDFRSVKSQEKRSPASEEPQMKQETQSSKREKKEQREQKEEFPGLTAARNEITLKQVLNTVKMIERQPVLQEHLKPIVVEGVVSPENQPLTDIRVKPDGVSLPNTASPSTLVAQPPVSFASQKVPALGTPKETPPVTPTVNVTIGRIEVRATPPPTSKSRKQPSTPPVMSLEEYLRKRSEGGRE